MECVYHSIRIREATVEDAPLLRSWWNDGAVMEHAGFPNGLGTTIQRVAEQIKQQSKANCRHIILCSDIPIGEMNYRETDAVTCEIGIKICDPAYQNKGLGKQILSLFIHTLFTEYRYRKIVLDTNLNNLRAQHVYEQLGFQKTAVRYHSWRDQLGRLQSAVDYELTADTFVSYL